MNQMSEPIQQLDHLHLINFLASPQSNTWKPCYSPYCIFTISYTLNPHSRSRLRWNWEISRLMGVSSSLESYILLISAGKPYVGSLLLQTNSLDGELLPRLYYYWWNQRWWLEVLSIWLIFVEQDDSLFDSSKNSSPRVVSTLSNVLRHTPSVPSIIITDLQEIVVFTPVQTGDAHGGTYERVKTTEFSLALRVITAAYLDRELPDRVFLNRPDVDNGVNTDLVFPEGP